jgi:hypothetical protein
MGSPSSAGASADTDRRWIIGIGISLVFGVFGAVMSLLAYHDRDKPPSQLSAPAATATTRAPATPALSAVPAVPALPAVTTATAASERTAPPGHGKSHGHP